LGCNQVDQSACTEKIPIKRACVPLRAGEKRAINCLNNIKAFHEVPEVRLKVSPCKTTRGRKAWPSGRSNIPLEGLLQSFSSKGSNSLLKSRWGHLCPVISGPAPRQSAAPSRLLLGIHSRRLSMLPRLPRGNTHPPRQGRWQVRPLLSPLWPGGCTNEFHIVRQTQRQSMHRLASTTQARPAIRRTLWNCTKCMLDMARR
jgi:hypothetical protein